MDNKPSEREQKLREGIHQLQDELSKAMLRHKLIAALLSADQIHEGVAEYQRVLDEEYLEYSKQETAYQGEAAALIELQDIQSELKVIGAYPNFHIKRTIAVAGGFSTGKSEFISSLFDDSTFRLPIGMRPTTAIPTYAMSSGKESNEVLGCSIRGGTVNLSELDPDLHSRLSHEFIRSFDFNLKSIMPYIFLSTPMSSFQHLCFIDTPGYNPADTEGGHTHEDLDTAANFTDNAEAVLWLIGADASGTIPQSDLNFLEALSDSDKPIYVVYNKADLKPEEDLEDILEEISEQLNDADIPIRGISAYSAVKRCEMTHLTQSLPDFLHELDRPSNKREKLLERIEVIRCNYIAAISDEREDNQRIIEQLKSLQLDILESGTSLDDNDASDRIDYIKTQFDVSTQAQRIATITNICKGFSSAIYQVFGELPTYDDYHRPTGSTVVGTPELKDVPAQPPQWSKSGNILKDINDRLDKVEEKFKHWFNK